MPILKDFARRFSPPTPRFQSPPSTPFNSASDAFELHPDVRRFVWNDPQWAYLHDAASSEQWEDFENFDVETNDFGLSRTQGDVTFGEWKSSRRAWEGKVRLYRAERERRGEVRLLPIRPRSRGARRSLRTFPVVTLHPRFPFNV